MNKDAGTLVKEYPYGSIRKFTTSSGYKYEAYVPKDCNDNTALMLYEHGDGNESYNDNWYPYIQRFESEKCNSIIIHADRNLYAQVYDDAAKQLGIDIESKSQGPITISHSGGTTYAIQELAKIIENNPNCKPGITAAMDGYIPTDYMVSQGIVDTFKKNNTIVLGFAQNDKFKSNNYFEYYKTFAKTGVNMLILQDDSDYGNSHGAVNSSFAKAHVLDYIEGTGTLPDNYRITAYDSNTGKFVDVDYNDVKDLKSLYSYFGIEGGNVSLLNKPDKTETNNSDINIDPLTFESARQCLNKANQILDGMITTSSMDQSFLSKLDRGTTFNTTSFKSNWQSGCANLYSRVTNVIEAISTADATQAAMFEKYKTYDLAGLYASILKEQSVPTTTTPLQTETSTESIQNNLSGIVGALGGTAIGGMIGSNAVSNSQTTTQANTQSTQTTGTTTQNSGYSGNYSGGSSSGGNSSGGSSSHSGGSSSGGGSSSSGSSSNENTQTQKPETKPVETKPTEPTQTETKPQEQVQVKDEELEKYEQEELEIEKERLNLEKERLELEKQRLEHEKNKEPVKIENNNINNNTYNGSGSGKTESKTDTNSSSTSIDKNGNIVIENNNVNNNVYNASSSTSGGSTSKPSVSRPSTNTTPSVNNTPTVNTPVIENTPSIDDTPVVELPPVENNDNFFVTPGGLDTPEIPNVEVISPIEDIKPVEIITPTVQKSSNNTGLILGAAAATAAVGAAAYGAYKYTKKKEEETGYSYEDKDYDSLNENNSHEEYYIPSSETTDNISDEI